MLQSFSKLGWLGLVWYGTRSSVSENYISNLNCVSCVFMCGLLKFWFFVSYLIFGRFLCICIPFQYSMSQLAGAHVSDHQQQQQQRKKKIEKTFTFYNCSILNVKTFCNAHLYVIHEIKIKIRMCDVLQHRAAHAHSHSHKSFILI